MKLIYYLIIFVILRERKFTLNSMIRYWKTASLSSGIFSGIPRCAQSSW